MTSSASVSCIHSSSSSSSSNSSCLLLLATILELEIRDQSYLNSLFLVPDSYVLGFLTYYYSSGPWLGGRESGGKERGRGNRRRVGRLGRGRVTHG